MWVLVALVVAAALCLAPRPRAECWAHPAVPAHVISVPGTRSRAEVRARFDAACQPFQFVDGVDGQTAPRIGSLTPGQVGCALSHMRLWQALEHSATPALIFEDDAQLPRDWRTLLDAVVRSVPAGVDVVFLGHCHETQGRKHSEHLHHSVTPRCTHGYLATPSGLRKLAAWARAGGGTDPIDEELARLIREGRLTGLSSFPPLVVTTEQASLIGAMKK